MRALILALAILPAAVQAQADPRSVESEPSLPAERLVAEGTPLSGEDWRLDTPVPVRGFLGQFVIQSPWGPIEAQGRELLELRIAELDALGRLDTLSHTKVFAGAIADSARATGAAIGRVVTRPVETVKGVPAGIGRLIRRTASSARNLAVTVGDTARRTLDDSDDGESSDGTAKVKNFANELAGVNKARRDLAREIGIDPYTRNPLIQERLEKMAWAAVAGGMSMDLMMGQIGGSAADLISTSRKIDGLVWDLPPDDIRRQLEAKLVDRGIDAVTAREFLRSATFTPTLQVEFVESMEALGRPTGELDLIVLARTIESEVHARFLIQQLKMLARAVPEDDPISEIVAFDASIGALSRSGDLWITLPVDFLSWSETANLVAAKDDDPPSHLVVAGEASERAREELERAGWRVEAGVGLGSI